MVGKLIYLSYTWLDIAYLVIVIGQFIHDPDTSHLDTIYCILRYLKFALYNGLFFSSNEHLKVEAFTHVNWVGSLGDRRSTFENYVFIGGNMILWGSKKQHITALFSEKAEYRVMTYWVCELLWLKNLLQELKITISGLISLLCDNKAAINIAYNLVKHDRTKYIEVAECFIKKKSWIKRLLVDVFTKIDMRDIHKVECC